MKSALYTGYVSHRRFIPRSHRFRYPFFMWFLELDRVAELPDFGRWFSTRNFALSRFHRPDYLGPAEEPLHISVKNRLHELTGIPVEGKVYGLLNLRTLGLYFSPVNFYYGYDKEGTCTHMLAEVSNIPWNERHHYAHYLGSAGAGDVCTPSHEKAFKVSPFNPVGQHYTWQIEKPGQTVAVQISVDDERGRVFEARLDLKNNALNTSTIRRQLLRRPVMTASVVGSIYWQALKLYLKGVPYVPYQREMT